MKRVFFALLFTLLLTSVGKAQTDSSRELRSTPTIGFGIGTVGFYGDLHDRSYGSPITSNTVISIYIKQPLTPFLDVRFNYLNGKIREEERTIKRNVNFETDFQSGAFYLDYNFGNFLSPDRKITPYISAGIEVINFNPKTDIMNSEGIRYRYWSDGTIRSIGENSPNASKAKIIHRDYSYETDVREVGFNPSTTYEKSALVIPVGIGFSMKLNDQFNFRIESMMHLSFTDYIDGITPQSSRKFVNGKKGNGNNDHYLVNSASITYNFQRVKPATPIEFEEDVIREPVDFLASGNTEDFDGDGVIDLVDKCPNTPKGFAVDSTGCPVDSDGDGVPDGLDEEPNSTNPNRADEKGVEQTDEMIEIAYLQSIDSTGEYAEVVERNFGKKYQIDLRYRVKVDEVEDNSTPEDMDKLLSISDLSKTKEGNKTIYTVGNYKSLSEADQRAAEMKQSGFGDAAVLEKSILGDYKDINREVNTDNATVTNANSNTPVFRVQLGAFKNKPSEDHFNRISNLFVVKSGSYYRYMSGSFENFGDAAKHKIKMIVAGYEDAFVVAYKNGKRVSLSSVGVKSIGSDPIIGK